MPNWRRVRNCSMLKRCWQRLRALERETRGRSSGRLLDNSKEASIYISLSFASGVHTMNRRGFDRATDQQACFDVLLTNGNLLLHTAFAGVTRLRSDPVRKHLHVQWLLIALYIFNHPAPKYKKHSIMETPVPVTIVTMRLEQVHSSCSFKQSQTSIRPR